MFPHSLPREQTLQQVGGLRRNPGSWSTLPGGTIPSPLKPGQAANPPGRAHLPIGKPPRGQARVGSSQRRGLGRAGRLHTGAGTSCVAHGAALFSAWRAAQRVCHGCSALPSEGDSDLNFVQFSHITKYYSCFDLFQPFKSAKAILSLQTVQSRAVGRIGCGHSVVC